MVKLTIYDIKRLTENTAPMFFDRKTLKFFGQKMKDFKVYKLEDGKYQICAPRLHGGYTQRIFNPETNILEHFSTRSSI